MFNGRLELVYVILHSRAMIMFALDFVGGSCVGLLRDSPTRC